MYSQRVKSTRPSGSICGLKSDSVFMLTQRRRLPSGSMRYRFDAGPGWHTVYPPRRVETKMMSPPGRTHGLTS